MNLKVLFDPLKYDLSVSLYVILVTLYFRDQLSILTNY